MQAIVDLEHSALLVIGVIPKGVRDERVVVERAKEI